jgi:hypothetical protein
MQYSVVKIVIEPPRAPWLRPADPGDVSARAFYALDRFAEEIQKYTQSEVMVVEQRLSTVPADGFVLFQPDGLFSDALAECELRLRDSLLQRMVLLNADRSNVVELLEQHRLTAAIEKHRFFLWRTRPNRDVGYGLYGLRSVAEAMGAETYGPISQHGERYCELGSPRYANLPALLVGYLDEYAQTVVVPQP